MNKEKQQIKERLNAQENLYTKEELLALAKRIRPVMRGTKHYVGLRPTGYEIHQILHTTKAMEHLK